MRISGRPLLRICPNVRIEPAQLVRRTPANGLAQDRFIRVENGELFQEFFRFPQSVGLFENGVASNWACYRCDELNDGLVRQARGSLDDALPENLDGNLLFFGESVVEPVDQNVGINESGHARRDPLFSILGREAAR